MILCVLLLYLYMKLLIVLCSAFHLVFACILVGEVVKIARHVFVWVRKQCICDKSLCMASVSRSSVHNRSHFGLPSEIPMTAAPAECSSASSLILSLSKPSVTLDHTESRWCQKLAVMTKEFLDQRFRSFVLQHASEALAVSYSNDPTPLTVRQRTQLQDDGEERVIRSGGKSLEFLIQRAWAIVHSGASSVVFTTPRPMQRKTAAAHFEGLRSLAVFPIEMGHRGLNISHMCTDRGIFGSQYRLFVQAHHRAVEQVTATMEAGEGALFAKLSWVVGNGCCDHDAHNSLKRAFAERLDDPQFMKDVWKIFASVREGFSSLSEHVWAWVADRLSFVDWALPPDAQHQLWRILGVPPDWCDLLVELQLRWENGALCIAKRHEESAATAMRQVVKSQLRLWQFRAWTASRWLSLGGRARTMISCCLLGLPDLVQYCLTTKGVSAYYLGGFTTDEPILQFLLVCGVASFVSESSLAQFFTDDRLPRLMDRLEADLAAEIENLLDISGPVWRVLAAVASMPPQLLRHEVLKAGHTQAGYLLWRCSDARALPWSLCIGDCMANLAALKEGERPSDLGCAAKIWDLLQAGFPQAPLVEGISLLVRLSFSAKRVEEGHVQGSRLAQLHKKYGEAIRVGSDLGIANYGMEFWSFT